MNKKRIIRLGTLREIGASIPKPPRQDRLLKRSARQVASRLGIRIRWKP